MQAKVVLVVEEGREEVKRELFTVWVGDQIRRVGEEERERERKEKGEAGWLTPDYFSVPSNSLA